MIRGKCPLPSRLEGLGMGSVMSSRSVVRAGVMTRRKTNLMHLRTETRPLYQTTLKFQPHIRCLRPWRARKVSKSDCDMQRPTTVTGNSDAGKIGNIYIYGTTTNFGITTMHDDFDDFDNDRHPEMELQLHWLSTCNLNCPYFFSCPSLTA